MHCKSRSIISLPPSKPSPHLLELADLQVQAAAGAVRLARARLGRRAPRRQRRRRLELRREVGPLGRQLAAQRLHLRRQAGALGGQGDGLAARLRVRRVAARGVGGELLARGAL
jgi:hypothetical protein